MNRGYGSPHGLIQRPKEAKTRMHGIHSEDPKHQMGDHSPKRGQKGTKTDLGEAGQDGAQRAGGGITHCSPGILSYLKISKGPSWSGSFEDCWEADF